MQQITLGTINRLLARHEPPCVSIYMPTHRKHVDSMIDLTRFRNVLRRAERELRAAGHRPADVSRLLDGLPSPDYAGRATADAVTPAMVEADRKQCLAPLARARALAPLDLPGLKELLAGRIDPSQMDLFVEDEG